MSTRYDNELPQRQLQRLEAEREHINQLAGAARMWRAAASIVHTSRTELHDYTENLRNNAWFDEAGADFHDRVGKSVAVLDSWRDAADQNLHRLNNLLHTLSFDYPDICAAVRKEADDYVRDVHANGSADPRPYQERAGAHTARLDSYYQAITWVLICLSSGSPWDGPRAALPAPGDAPGGPGGAPAGGPPGGPAGAPVGAGDPAPGAGPEPATVPEPQSPAVPAPTSPDDPQQPGDVLDAAASALGAASGLLDGAGTPTPVSLPPLPVDGLGAGGPSGTAGLPALAGLDVGAVGGPAAGGLSPVAGVGPAGPGTGGPGAVGTVPPVGGAVSSATGLIRGGGAATPMSAPMSPPMMPPAGAAGAAGARPGAAGIRPGDSDRPAAETRPRPRRGTATGPMTPGVALAGRAGAQAPKPAARRGWDSDNDSLQVLDEHLWQVSPEEEDIHGQDRRRRGRDGHDRPAAHAAPDAGLVGPGGRAGQPTRAG